MATISELANVTTKQLFPYSTSHKDWTKTVLFLTTKLSDAYGPTAKPIVDIKKIDGTDTIVQVFPGWRISRRTYTDLTVHLVEGKIEFIEDVDEDGELYPFDIWNSSMFPSILDVYDYITSLIIAHTRKY